MTWAEEKGVIVVDILHWIDQLETLLNEGWRVPLTTKVVIDGEECLNIIDQMRVSIPTEIRKAKRIQQEGQRIVVQGQEEADRIVTLAREQAIRMLNEDDLRTQVEARVNAILESAKKEAEQVRLGADSYALEVLGELEARISTLKTTVENGIAALKKQQESTAEGQTPDATSE